MVIRISEWLTITELADRTEISESTVRRYLQNFSTFFDSKGGKRSKQYEVTAVKVLGRIRELFEKGLETMEVRRVLSQEYSMIIDGETVAVEDENKQENSGAPALATAEDVAAIHALIEEQRIFNKTLLELLQNQERYIQHLLENQQSLIATTTEEEAETVEVVEKKSFFRRFFK